MSKLKRSILFFTVFLVLTVSIFWWGYLSERLETSAQTNETLKKTLIFELRPERVNHIKIQYNNKNIVLHKDKFSWRMQEPLDSVVTHEKIEQTLMLISSLRSNSQLTEKQTQAALQFIVPEQVSRSIQITDINKNNFILELAAKHPSQNLFYVRCFKNKTNLGVFLVDSKIQFMNTLNQNSLLPNDLIQYDRSQLLAIRGTPTKQSKTSIDFELRARPTNLEVPEFRREIEYDVIDPNLGLADRLTVQRFFSALKSSPIKKVHVFSEKPSTDTEQDSAVWHLEKIKKISQSHQKFEFDLWVIPKKTKIANYRSMTEHSLEDTFDQSSDFPIKRVHLRLIESGDNSLIVYRDGENFAVEVGAFILPRLNFSEQELISKKVTEIERENIFRIEITKIDGAHLVFVKEESSGDQDVKWKILAPKPSQAKAYLLAGLLLQIADLQGFHKIKAKDKPHYQMLLNQYSLNTGISVMLKSQFEDQEETQQMLFSLRSKDSGEKAYVSVVGSQEIFEINTRLFRDLMKEGGEYIQEY